MKTIFKSIFAISLLSLFFASCGVDNYDEPESLLTGRISYNGEPVNVRGTEEQIRLQFYQYGYAYLNPIEVFVTQDGTFSAKLFNGEYHVVTRDRNGPWVNSRDTTVVHVNGNTVMELKVTPYFTISNSTITLDNNTMNTAFNITKIIETAQIDRIILLLNTTTFVDDAFNVMRKDFTGDEIRTGQVTYSAELNDKAKNAKTLFGRVCVWTSGVDQGIYSPVVRLR